MKQTKSRSKQGFSLILVASLGAAFLLMALAVGATVLPVFKAVGGTQPSRASAGPLESGIEYAIAQFNYTAKNNPSSLANLALIPVPPNITGSQFPVSVTVTLVPNQT